MHGVCVTLRDLARRMPIWVWRDVRSGFDPSQDDPCLVPSRLCLQIQGGGGACEPLQGLAGEQGMVECQRRGDVRVALPRLELVAGDFVVWPSTTDSYAAHAAKEARCILVGKSAHPEGSITSSVDRLMYALVCAASLITILARADEIKWTRFWKDVLDHAVDPVDAVCGRDAVVIWARRWCDSGSTSATWLLREGQARAAFRYRPRVARKKIGNE